MLNAKRFLQPLNGSSAKTVGSEPQAIVLVVGENVARFENLQRIFREQANLINAELIFFEWNGEDLPVIDSAELGLVIVDQKDGDISKPDLYKRIEKLKDQQVPVIFLDDNRSGKKEAAVGNPELIELVFAGPDALRALPRAVAKVLREQNRRRIISSLPGSGDNSLLQQKEQLQQMFEQVHVAKEEWEQTMDCLKDIVILTDPDGLIRRANEALLTLTGKNYDQLIGAPLSDVFENCRLAVQETPLRCVEMYHETSGRWFILETYEFEGLTMGPGKVITAHEYTWTRELNLQLEYANRNLESKRLELQKSLELQRAAQEKIIHQEKIATIGLLAAGVTHEINNPMGFILSNLESIKTYLEKLGHFVHIQNDFLRRDLDESGVAELDDLAKDLKIDLILDDLTDVVDESISGANRVRKIVGDLRGFIRQEDAQQEVTDINDILESAMTLVWNELKYKAVLQKDLQRPALVDCHARQLGQVFMNLLVNASQAIAERGSIAVSSRRIDHGWIEVVVKDDGCGMPDRVRKRIFEPFYTTKEIGRGTGLGLSISYDIIKEHGGEIMVESSPGMGTAFTVRLPGTNSGNFAGSENPAPHKGGMHGH